MFCGWVGMAIAVKANYRVTYRATESLEGAFRTAYCAGSVMGFSLIGISLLIMISLLLTYEAIFKPVALISSDRSWAILMELMAGYGLGGSSIALFGRVGGGIYTKAADVGADLVGKIEEGLDEDSPRNPATIADNVGDNVGDIAGMGSDLFGSFAESTCAALVFIGTTQELINHKTAIYYPFMISVAGIIACFFTSIFGIFIYKVKSVTKIEFSLKLQLGISTFLTLAILPLFTWLCLPTEWKFDNNGKTYTTNRWYAYLITSIGLISGFFIGLSTDYYTSNAHFPVVEMANICSSGAAINIIYGLALGYLSTIIPILLLSITIITGIKLCGMFGVALAALGMLSTLCVGLAIDAYGPISDNAGGIAEMCELEESVRDRTDALDAAGNTTAAIGKGFAIGSACLVSLALYGAFITRSKSFSKNALPTIEVTNGWIFGSMLAGGMLPYAFSAMTMKAVGRAANSMVKEVRRQFKDPRVRNGEVDPDYEACIMVSTRASLKEMIAPGLLVIMTPIILGVVFHPI